jgi:tetratricopeptide (TPR) repeat protein
MTLIGASAEAAAPQEVSEPGWVGAQVCKSCHSAEFEAWRGSHHDLAMQTVSPTSVLGDFDDARFEHGGVVSRFFRRGEEYWVETEGPNGKLQEYRVEYVFGYHPLQQYLLALPGGRLQALSIAWDSRASSEGGQRWYHLYPDETIPADDPLHWTGPYQNWNARCAECHSTNLKKNFDHQTGEYNTTWSEINVACESCHGAGGRHVNLAREDRSGSAPNRGFPVSLKEAGTWSFQPGEAIAERTRGLPRSQQVESCGRCHARRGSLGEYRYNRHLLDTHRVSLLESPLYHLDGQILDEVYVYGSFVQSAMYGAGVVCSNCHEPHSLELRAPDNAVCSQCHRPDRYNTASHHHHDVSSDGSLCANCHMPETSYMVVDPRRDHSMRVPRPDLSAALGTPNACNSCHTDRDAEWALNELREWGAKFSDTGSHPARVMSQSRKGDARAVPALQEIALDGDRPAIWRASAMVELGGYANREAYETAVELLKSHDPMVRLGAVRSLEFLTWQPLFGVLNQHLTDPNAAVRMEIARVLADVPLEQIDKRSAEELRVLFDSYLTTLGRHADMPETQLQMGVFFTAREYWGPAESAYKRALQLNPQFIAAALNLADLYRLQERNDEARKLLLQASTIAPNEGAVWHALGLLEIRTGNRELALGYLEKAAALESTGIRHRYVYAIALEDAGQVEEAIAALQAILRGAPENPDVLLALVTYCHEAGRREDARRYATTLRRLLPDNPEIQQLYDSL